MCDTTTILGEAHTARKEGHMAEKARVGVGSCVSWWKCNVLGTPEFAPTVPGWPCHLPLAHRLCVPSPDSIDDPERPGPPLGLGSPPHSGILFLYDQFCLLCLTEPISI